MKVHYVNHGLSTIAVCGIWSRLDSDFRATTNRMSVTCLRCLAKLRKMKEGK